MSADPFGTFANTLRARCTRHRCQDVSSITELIASRSPRCASEITNLTPAEAPGTQAAEERDPKRAVFGVADFDTEHFPVPAARHAGGHYHRLRHDPSAAAGLHVGGVEEHVRELDMVERPVPERLQGLVELASRSGSPRTSRSPTPHRGPGRGHRPCGSTRRGRRPPSPPRTRPGRSGGAARGSMGRSSRDAASGSPAPHRRPSSSPTSSESRCVDSCDSRVRSCGPAPITSVASASMSAWRTISTLERIRSTSPPARSASRSSDRSN